MNTKLEKEYTEQEYDRSLLPYKFYLDSLETVFDFSLVDSFLDIGCSNGRLLESIKKRHPHVQLQGCDYFKWAQEYADPSVRDAITLTDLAQPQDLGRTYSIVNCSEVGEHIEKASEEVFLDNVSKPVEDILVLTWSNAISHDNDQHQNPRPKKYIQGKLAKRGLVYWPEATASLAAALSEHIGRFGYPWWEDDIMVFRKLSFLPVQTTYFIQKIHTDDAGHRKNYTRRGLYPKSFQQSFMKLCTDVRALVDGKKSASIVRISDGDYYFLRQIPIGSAKPGKRAITKEYGHIQMDLYYKLVWLNDVLALSFERPMFVRWKKFLFYTFTDSIFRHMGRKLKRPRATLYMQYAFDALFGWIAGNWFFLKVWIPVAAMRERGAYKRQAERLLAKDLPPMDAVYALVGTKWIFKNFPGEIGIIAAKPKLDLIQVLMRSSEYQAYIGCEQFTDYIEVPQRGAADDVEQVARTIGPQLRKSKAKIFLVGAGSAKLALLPLLKEYTDAVFIDVGCGVDALAGIVCQDRPFFADWVNYRITGYDYTSVDFMDEGNPAWQNPLYTTKWLSHE